MKRNLEPEKVLVPTPQPVKARASSSFDYWAFRIAGALIVVSCVVVVSNLTKPKPPTETLPLYTFENCETCQACEPATCPDCTWLSRFVGALDVEAETPLEIRDVLHRAYIESRFNEKAVSETGDWGICQINAKSHPWIDTQRLLTDPEYAASQCLDAYRTAKKACGKRWECCYRYGVSGCKGRSKP